MKYLLVLISLASFGCQSLTKTEIPAPENKVTGTSTKIKRSIASEDGDEAKTYYPSDDE